MGRTPEDAIREGAEAAKSLIPEAEREVEDRQRALTMAQARLAALRTLASSAEALSADQYRFGMVTAISSPRPTVTATTTAISTSTGEPLSIQHNVNIPTGDKVEAILKKEGKPLLTRELALGIELVFGGDVPMSTLYAALATGRKNGRFIYTEDGRWVLGKSEGQE
jgi:hypothetical protein